MSTTTRTVLVTGGAGFIGSNFTRLHLEGTTDRVVVLDALTYAGSLENLTDVIDDPRLVFVHGNIANRQLVREVFETHRPEIVINFAAESHVDRSIDSPGEFVTTNIVGTFELLEASRAHCGDDSLDSRAFRFLHVSTDEVFGSLGETGAFEETTPYDPRSPYSASKASADHLVRAYFHTYDLPTIVTNCSNNYGPYQFPEKLIPLMILNAAEGRDLPIYGDGGNVRDWLHVEDHCRGLGKVVKAGVPGQSYNLGGEAERTNLQVVDQLCEIMSSELPADDNPALSARGYESYDQLKTFVTDRPGHDRRYAIDAKKIRTELDWTPERTFEEGLRETVRWYLDNRSWCQAVQSPESRHRRGLSADGDGS